MQHKLAGRCHSLNFQSDSRRMGASVHQTHSETQTLLTGRKDTCCSWEVYLVGGGACGALGAGGDHGRLQEDALKHDTVVSHVLEGLCPCVHGNLEGLVDGVLSVQHDLHSRQKA